MTNVAAKKRRGRKNETREQRFQRIYGTYLHALKPGWDAGMTSAQISWELRMRAWARQKEIEFDLETMRLNYIARRRAAFDPTPRPARRTL